MVFGIKIVIFIENEVYMSNEVLEMSVQLDQEFDVTFNLFEGILGYIIRMIGK